MQSSHSFIYGCNNSPTLLLGKRLSKRPNSYVSAIDNSVIAVADIDISIFYYLPKEVWLNILVNYGLSSVDLAHLEMTCRWFNVCWDDNTSMTEEAARLIVKKHRRTRFGELTNKLKPSTWKERLYILERLDKNSSTLAAGSYQNIALSRDRILVWGAGKFGQLGNGVRRDISDPQDISRSLNDKNKIVQVSAGCGHTGILTETGEVYSFGDNRYGQLGHANFRGQQCLVPTKISPGLNNIHVVQIACGSSHTLFLSDRGTVYSVGHGDSGQLGLGPRVKSATEPMLLPLKYEDFNFVFITTGIAHNVLLTECGKTFTCGLGSVGQLGHGGTKNLSSPAQVTAFVYCKKIVHAAASVCHTVLVDSEGRTYTCGKGSGILGHGNSSSITTVPKPVHALRDVRVERVFAGVGRTIFITKTGQGYWCGEGIGVYSTQEVPVKMDIPESLHTAAIGNSHVVLKTKSNRLMSLGKNGRFQTGHANIDEPITTYSYIPV